MTDRERAICARVRDFREKIKWPQPAFAYELGITKDKLASIEYGRTPLRYGLGYRLCFMFDVNQEWLANGRGPVTPFTLSWHAPLPQSVPEKMLFGDLFADALSETSKLASTVETQIASERAKQADIRAFPVPPMNFDLTAYLMKRILEIVEREDLTDPCERFAFAQDVASLALTVALKRRQRRIARHVKKAGGFQAFKDRLNPDLSKESVERAKKILKLKEKIKYLQGQVMMLEDDEDDAQRQVKGEIKKG